MRTRPGMHQQTAEDWGSCVDVANLQSVACQTRPTPWLHGSQPRVLEWLTSAGSLTNSPPLISKHGSPHLTIPKPRSQTPLLSPALNTTHAKVSPPYCHPWSRRINRLSIVPDQPGSRGRDFEAIPRFLNVSGCDSPTSRIKI